MSRDFASFAAQGLRSERFKLVDIGCAGGIDARWRVFGDRLEAIALDASVEECSRLAAMEQNSAVSYVAGFAGGSDQPVDVMDDPAWRRVVKLLRRLSHERMLEIRRSRLKSAGIGEKIHNNAWTLTTLADPSRPIVIPRLLESRGWSDFDLLKIDIDGLDYQVLQSFEGKLAESGVLAVQLEANFVGGVGPQEHVFHNTDRFMRRHGYELFRLDVRNYSSGALPARFLITSPAQTVTGRPVQGDAFYARDVVSSPMALSPEKLLKLAVIAASWNVPDIAAEILVAHRDGLAGLLDVDTALDLLAAQTQEGRDEVLSYRDYVRAFETEDPGFFPDPPRSPPPPTFGQRLRAMAAAFGDVVYADKLEQDRARRRARTTRSSARS